MNSFDEFAYPERFQVSKSDGSVSEFRGSINAAEIYLVTGENITPDDNVVRLLPTGSQESYIVLDAQFLAAAMGSPDLQRLTVKRDFS